jgi:hypothetical protein
LTVDDQDVCTYESVSVSFANSFSATSTLQIYSVDWGDGNISNGVWPPAASIAHPAGGYILPGNYVIILTVTDLLGATGSAAVDVYVGDCWDPMPGYGPGYGVPPVGAHQVIISRKYDDDAYFTDDITANPPIWTNQKDDANRGKYIIMPSLTTQRFFGYNWGIYEYTSPPFDTGAWSTKYTEAQLATLFGHGADYNECYIFRMIFSANPIHEEWAWAGVYLWWTDGGGDDHVLYGIIHTSDAWTSTQYAHTILDLEEGVSMEDILGPCQECDIGYDDHGDQLYMLIAKAPEEDGASNPTHDGWWRLYWSQDYGYTWNLGQQKTFEWGNPYYNIDLYDMNCSIWVPWRDNEFNGGTLYWTVCLVQETNLAWDYITIPQIFYSHNFALTRTDISDVNGKPGCALTMVKGPWNSIHRVYGVMQPDDTADGHVGQVWTFRGDGPAYGWTLFRDTNPHVDECRCMIIYEQDGYALKTLLATCDPRWITSGSDTDKQRPSDDSFWAIWIP